MTKNHPTTTTNLKWAALLAAAVLLATAGCQSNNDKAAEQPKILHGEQFDPEQSKSVSNVADVQAAAGAKADGMLDADHFHGNKLNSLGESKLHLITKGTATTDPVVVYLDIPADGIAARKPAVVAYLKNNEHLTDARIKVVDGANPDDNTPTAYNLSQIYKSKGDGGGFTGEPAEPTAGGGEAGAASMAPSAGGH
jgi:hypothetical protein